MSNLRRWVALLALSGVLAGCGGTPEVSTDATVEPTSTVASTAAPAATSAPAPTITAEPTIAPNVEPTTVVEPEITATEASGSATSEDAIRASMQKTLDTYNAAYMEGDEAKLLAAIDPKSLAVKRSLLSQFENAMASQFAGRYAPEGEVIAVRDRGNGYYEGTIATSSGGNDRQVKQWSFRQVGDEWLISEPSRAELGKKLTYDTEHFEIEYYAWDEEIIDEIGTVMETAYQTVLDKLGKVPEGRLHARIVPTYSSGSMTGGNTVAWYQSGGAAHNPDRIVMRSPLSIGFIRSYSEAEGFSVDLQHDITHEFTHQTVNRMFGGNARLGSGFSWMSEGIAEHVAGASYPDTIRGMIANDGLIPLQDKSGVLEKQDLEHMYLLDKDFVLAYAQAVELVDFIYTEKGGYDGWWKFADSYARRQSIEDAVSEQFGMTVDEFEAKYHEFMKQKYG